MPSCLRYNVTGPIAVRRVTAIVSRRLVAGVFQLLDADQIRVARELTRQSEHQSQSLLGRRNVGPPANGQNLYARARARGAVDVACGETVFLHELEPVSGYGDFFGAYRQLFDDNDIGAGNVRQQLRLIGYELNVAGVDVGRLRADFLAPAGKVRRVVLAEMRKRFDALFRSRWVEDDLNEPEKTVVFDDELHGYRMRFKVQRSKVQRFEPLSDVKP
jgi:hypothetical protein